MDIKGSYCLYTDHWTTTFKTPSVSTNQLSAEHHYANGSPAHCFLESVTTKGRCSRAHIFGVFFFCICIHVSTWTCICVHAHRCVWRPKTKDRCFHCFLYLLRQGLLLKPRAYKSVSSPECWEYRQLPHPLAFYVGARDSNSSPRPCTSALSTGPFCMPPHPC